MPMTSRRKRLAGGLAAYLVFLGWAFFAPTSNTQSGLVVDLVELLRRVGLPHGLVTYARMEFAMNAAIVIPAVAAAAFLLRRPSWRDWTAWAFVASGLVELVQGLFLPHRQAAFSDVVSNTLGATLGAWLALALGGRLRKRRPR
jgi:glycopeptide antibiotics resistance protein